MSTADRTAIMERVIGMAGDVLARTGNDFEAALDVLCAEIRDDAALLWALFEPWRLPLLRGVLAAAAAKRRNAGGQGQCARATHSAPAEPAGGAAGHLMRSDTPESVAGGPDLHGGDTHIANVGAATGPGDQLELATQLPSVARPAHSPERRGTAGLGSLAAVARSVALERQTELGKPVGDCTAAELRALSRRSRRDAFFYDALARQLPDRGVARDYVTADEADALWAAAEHRNSEEASTS